MKYQKSEIGSKLVVGPAHTPTPWHSYGRFIRLNNDVHIAQTEIEVDAEFIIRAVNSHEALLNVAISLKKFGWANDPNTLSMELRKIINEASNAIAQAEARP